MGDPREDDRSFDESDEFEIEPDGEDLLGLEKLDEDGNPIDTQDEDTDETESDDSDGDDADA